jgi:hypothetical protein
MVQRYLKCLRVELIRRYYPLKREDKGTRYISQDSPDQYSLCHGLANSSCGNVLELIRLIRNVENPAH